MPKRCTLFCLVHIKKKPLCLTSCVFWFVFLDAGIIIVISLFDILEKQSVKKQTNKEGDN